MRLTYINVLKLLNAIVKTTTTERVPGGYSQDVVGVHPELGADVGGLVPPLARLLVHHLRHHLDTGGVRPGVIFPVASAGLCDYDVLCGVNGPRMTGIQDTGLRLSPGPNIESVVDSLDISG